MIELIVVLVVLAAMSAVVVPQVLGRLQTGSAATLAQTLTALRSSVIAFRSDILQYPSQLVHLSSIPPAGAADPCGRLYGSTVRWRGPYLDRAVQSSGLKLGGSTVLNTIRRTPTLSTSIHGTVFVDVDDVDLDVAQTVNTAIDGDGVLTAGSITWVAATGTPTRGQLSMGIPVRGC